MTAQMPDPVMTVFETTPSQTVGPYFAIGLVGPVMWPDAAFAVPEGTPGAIRVTGTVFDGAGVEIPDHIVEVWGADPDGKFADLFGYGGPSSYEGFRGFARSGEEDGQGEFSVLTLKPGPVPGLGGTTQAPHLDVSLFARGMLHRVVTRIYFGDEEAANAADPVLQSVPEARRHTLIATPVDGGYEFDIRLQGPDETVFFAV